MSLKSDTSTSINLCDERERGKERKDVTGMHSGTLFFFVTSYMYNRAAGGAHDASITYQQS